MFSVNAEIIGGRVIYSGGYLVLSKSGYSLPAKKLAKIWPVGGLETVWMTEKSV
jgi:hypothetical protein